MHMSAEKKTEVTSVIILNAGFKEYKLYNWTENVPECGYELQAKWYVSVWHKCNYVGTSLPSSFALHRIN